MKDMFSMRKLHFELDQKIKKISIKIIYKDGKYDLCVGSANKLFKTLNFYMNHQDLTFKNMLKVEIDVKMDDGKNIKCKVCPERAIATLEYFISCENSEEELKRNNESLTDEGDYSNLSIVLLKINPLYFLIQSQLKPISGTFVKLIGEKDNKNEIKKSLLFFVIFSAS